MTIIWQINFLDMLLYILQYSKINRRINKSKFKEKIIMFKNKINFVSLGIAIFTMIFGAGNIIFPLILGRDTGNMIYASMTGFVITAVLVPILGLIATVLYEGDYNKILSSFGKIPSSIMIFVIMFFLIGPFGATARCFILSYSSMHYYMPSVPIWMYVFVATFFVFFIAYKENKVVDILGTILGPIKFTLLLAIIVIGFSNLAPFSITNYTPSTGFSYGIKQGYYTLDLLGTIFFAHLIYVSIKTKFVDDLNPKRIILLCLKAGVVCAILLGFIYYGFGIISASWATKLTDVPQEQLLSILSIKVLGSGAAFLSNLAVAIATIVTAIVLTTVFSDYLAFTLLKGKISYHTALIISLLTSLIMVNFQFAGIMMIISLIAVAIYPAIIVLATLKIFHKLFGFKEKYISPVVWTVLIITIFYNYILPLMK